MLLYCIAVCFCNCTFCVFRCCNFVHCRKLQCVPDFELCICVHSSDRAISGNKLKQRASTLPSIVLQRSQPTQQSPAFFLCLLSFIFFLDFLPFVFACCLLSYMLSFVFVCCVSSRSGSKNPIPRSKTKMMIEQVVGSMVIETNGPSTDSVSSATSSATATASATSSLEHTTLPH